MPYMPHSMPAAPDADDSPVDIVLRWRRCQLAVVATLFLGGVHAAGAAEETRDLGTAHSAARTIDPALAAALRGEHRHALGVARALSSVAGDGDRLDGLDVLDGLDAALVELLVARAVTRRALRAVLVRDYDCAGCCAEAGEPCFPNCLPSERNTVYSPEFTALLDESSEPTGDYTGPASGVPSRQLPGPPAWAPSDADGDTDAGDELR